jgi:hypothetical protein
MKLRSNTKLL